MKSIQEKYKKAKPALKAKLSVANDMALPRIVKVVIAAGTGSTKDAKKLELIPDRLAKITGQKPAPTLAKKAISTFKTRVGDTVGQMVTLRGERMYSFLDRLLNAALPRQRDFRGIDPNAIDEIGNLTVGVKEHTVFPETADEELKNVFGFGVTIVTTAKDRKTAEVFFRELGFPFKRK